MFSDHRNPVYHSQQSPHYTTKPKFFKTKPQGQLTFTFSIHRKEYLVK